MVDKTVEVSQEAENLTAFSLPYFEFLVCVRRYEEAGRLLILMLEQLDTQYGRWDVFRLSNNRYNNRNIIVIGSRQLLATYFLILDLCYRKKDSYNLLISIVGLH